MALMSTYNSLPITLTHGVGVHLWDTDGKRYLDALGGIAVNALGHAHPSITAAIAHQSARLMHSSNVYRIEAQEILGQMLCDLARMDRVFFGNSGAEANEAMIKIARLHARTRKLDNPHIVVMERAFHGRTLATASATDHPQSHTSFAPMVQGFVRVPHNCIASIEQLAAQDPNIVAVMMEPIQGEGGINLADKDYMRALRSLCDRHNWLLMCDEVQSGMGRTGHWFAHQQADIVPDVMAVAKALGNGFPIGACLARGAAADLMTPGSHGSTFGGNPLGCAVGRAVVETIERDGLLERAAQLGERIQTGLRERLGQVPGVVDVRGSGLMIGIELDRPCRELVQRALGAGLLINVTRERVVRLLPAYILSDDQADEIASATACLIADFMRDTTA